MQQRQQEQSEPKKGVADVRFLVVFLSKIYGRTARILASCINPWIIVKIYGSESGVFELQHLLSQI